MKYRKIDVSLPNWISTRTYLFKTNESRTYINNEKNHTYIQLDGLTSDFWFLLIGDNENIFYRFVDDNDLSDQFDTFLETLAIQELILLNGYENSNINNQYLKQKTSNINESDKLFIENRSNWLMSHGFMSHLFFELTYRCNLKCIHCYNPKNKSDIEIDIDVAKKAVDDAYELGAFTITLSGGESSTYSHFLELAKYIRNKHMALEIFTNGQTLYSNKDMYDTIISLYPNQICISLYSTNEETHDKVTSVDGSFINTYELIKSIRKDNINVQIKNFLLNYNCMDCIQVAEFAKSINASSIVDISLIPTIDGDKKTFNYIINENKLFELFSNPESPLYVGDNPYIFNIEDNKNESPCLGGFTGLCISPTLDVNICVSMPKPVGNLKTSSIKDIWNSANNKDEDSLLYQWRKVTNSDLTDCYKHDYCKFCHYCAGMALLENGYLKKSNILCMQAKTKLKAYNYIKNKQQPKINNNRG